MYCILMGNPMEGFVVVGPFEHREHAAAYLASEPASTENMFIVEMSVPAVMENHQRTADRIDGYDRDDLGLSPD